MLSFLGFDWPKYCFWPKMNMEWGVVIYIYTYLKHSPDDPDSKHCVCRSSTLGRSVISKVPFLTSSLEVTKEIVIDEIYMCVCVQICICIHT